MGPDSGTRKYFYDDEHMTWFELPESGTGCREIYKF